MTDTISESGNELQNVNNCGPWYQGTHGEYIAVRLSSRDTNGRYAIVESVADPGSATPMHLHATRKSILSSLQVAIASPLKIESLRRRRGQVSPFQRALPIAGAIFQAYPGAW